MAVFLRSFFADLPDLGNPESLDTRLDAFRLESELVESFCRIYYFAKTVTDDESSHKKNSKTETETDAA